MAISSEDIGKRFVITVSRETYGKQFSVEYMLCFLTDHNGRPCSVPIMGSGYVIPSKYFSQKEAEKQKHKEALDSLASMLNDLADKVRNGEIRIAYDDQEAGA